MPITLEDIRRVAALASLDLDDSEAVRLRRDLQSILEHVAVLEGVVPDRPDRAEEARPTRLRADTVTEAPRADPVTVRVPRVIDP